MRRATNRWWILAVAAIFFAVGVVSVSMDRGAFRSTLLTVAFAGLLAIALRQTAYRMRAHEGADDEGDNHEGADGEGDNHEGADGEDNPGEDGREDNDNDNRKR